MENATEQEFISKDDKPLAVYDPLRAQLEELRKLNAAQVFDYKDPKGNKEARSHVYQLRKSKGAIETARKDTKAAALAFGRKVDAEAADLIKQVEEMIDVHQKPLDEIEAAEKARVEGIRARISRMETLGEGLAVLPAAILQNRLEELEKITVDDSFGEFLGDAAKAHDLALLRVKTQLPETAKREAEAKELEELRKMRAEKEAKEKAEAEAKAAEERRVAAENAARAAETKAAEERAKAAEIARMQAEERAKEAEERAEREKAANAKRLKEMAEQAKADAEAKAKADQEAKEKAEADAKAKREANEKHVAKVHAEIVDDLMRFEDFESNKGLAEYLCEIISHGKIRHLSINY